MLNVEKKILENYERLLNKYNQETAKMQKHLPQIFIGKVFLTILAEAMKAIFVILP